MRELIFAVALVAAGPALADTLTLEVAGEANGTIVIELAKDLAPGHVAQIETLAERGDYDGVVFHRVIEGFMAQTGDVQYGRADGDLAQAGMGGSDLPDLKAEFSDTAHFERGTVGMARARDPDSANSQFFIMFAPAPYLDGSYTIVGQVTEGMEVVDKIKRGEGPNGAMLGTPDRIVKATVKKD
jgi:peptidylprolyl isomerase